MTVGACSKPSAGPVDETVALIDGFNPCSLFTLEQVSEFVGAPVDVTAKINAPDADGLASAGGCQWSKTDPLGKQTRLQLVVGHVTDFDKAKAPLEAETQLLVGLGDWAGWNTTDTNMNVAALNHNIAMIVSCDIVSWDEAVPAKGATGGAATRFAAAGEAQRNHCNVPIIQDLLQRLI